MPRGASLDANALLWLLHFVAAAGEQRSVGPKLLYARRDMTELPEYKMPEAEVSLRLAFGLLARNLAVRRIEVAIDGAQVKTGNTVHFPLVEFLEDNGWCPVASPNTWQGAYSHPYHEVGIVIHSSPGKGDVVAYLSNGRTLRVESKKGPLIPSKSSQEYPLIREALGQLLTVEEAECTDILAVAVPSSDKFEALAEQWRSRPLMVHAGVHIATIDRENRIRGLEDVGV
jgi:hypothetical protein